MPGGDRTGPMGKGSRTGWGRGNCSEAQGPELGGGGFSGRGRGFVGGGSGGGRGRRNRFRSTGTPGSMRGAAIPPNFADTGSTADTELQWLERRSAALEAEQQQIKARLDRLVGETD